MQRLMFSNFFLLTVILSLFTFCKKTEDPIPVISTQLSFSKNPTSYWQVGYTKGTTLDSDQFQLSTFADTTTSNSIGMWHPFSGQPGYYPYVGQNRTSASTTEPTNGWAVKPGQIAMEGSNSGQYSVLQFIAPRKGKYKIKATFEGIHFGLSTTDVHILNNSQELLNKRIEGYGGDSSFHKIEGVSPSASFEEVLSLNKNDIITFAVGFGSNKNHYSDTTGLIVSIEFQ
jgi:hypothetical protein